MTEPTRAGPERRGIARRSTRWKMAAGLGLATTLVAVFAVLACLSTYRHLRDGRRVAHTLAVLEGLQGLQARLFDAESDERGYLITSDPQFLEPFRAARVEALGRLERLAELTADNPVQQERIAQLRPILTERLRRLADAIAIHQAQGSGASRVEVASGRGRALMVQIRELTAAMVAAERQLLDDRVFQSEFSARVAYATYAALLIPVLLLIGAVERLVRRDLRNRAATESALRQSRERFELAVRGSRDGIFDWDAHANRTYFSPRWKEMLGYTEGGITDDPGEFERRLHPDDRARVAAVLGAYLGPGPDHDRQYQEEVRLQHKDGSYRWVLTRGQALRDADGRAYRLAGSHTDITARKEAEATLSAQNQQLEAAVHAEKVARAALGQAQGQLVQSEKLAALGQMVAGVAHEINNPLAFVINNLAVFRRDLNDLCHLLALYGEAEPVLKVHAPDLWARIVEHSDEVDIPFVLRNFPGLLDRTDDGLRRIQGVVADLRLFARLDEGDRKEADLNAGIRSTATIVRGRARHAQVEVTLDLGPLPPVACQPARINQVVMNLLSNAIDACPPGGTVRVRSVVDPEPSDAVRVEVTDTGAGIDPHVLPRIFDPFFTTKPIGQGTGLGLSISYGIVRDHGGTIAVESVPGRGTTFTVCLPIAFPSLGLDLPPSETIDLPNEPNFAATLGQTTSSANGSAYADGFTPPEPAASFRSETNPKSPQVPDCQ